ncbi:conjugal transfer protein TraD, partial [Escherichia coli]|nr:conjugal transfer protein TraD [Escherichia coli]
LLGALVSLADNNVADEKRAEWKRKGDALLAAKGSK